MSSRKTVTRILATAAAVPLAFGTVMVPAHAAQDTAKPTAKYTMTQVKKHSKATNCWTVVGRNVYNLTSWVSRHPGGSSRIVAMCGKNSTAAFAAQHGSSANAQRSLAQFKIGTL